MSAPNFRCSSVFICSLAADPVTFKNTGSPLEKIYFRSVQTFFIVSGPFQRQKSNRAAKHLILTSEFFFFDHKIFISCDSNKYFLWSWGSQWECGAVWRISGLSKRTISIKFHVFFFTFLSCVYTSKHKNSGVDFEIKFDTSNIPKRGPKA